MSSLSTRLVLVAILGLAFALRMQGLADVFGEDGSVAFTVGDPYYHLRLAAWALEHFPSFLTFDTYLAYPDGSAVPWPPLYDVGVAASALVLGGSQQALETLSALWPPILGALTVLPVFAVGRSAAGAGCGLAAAATLAVLPVSVVVSQVGNADHHAAVALLATTWLALQGVLLRANAAGSPSRDAALAAALALVRAALLTTWGLGVTYLAIADVPFVLAAVAHGRRRTLALQAGSLAATACLVAPVVHRMVSGGGAAATPFMLSWLTIAALAALAVWSAIAAARARADLRPLRRLVECAGAGAIVLGGVLVAFPELLAESARVGDLATRQDVWAMANPEQLPLWVDARPRLLALAQLGALGLLIPVLPFALAGLSLTRRSVTCLPLLAMWSAGLGVLAISQVRFANDYSPVGSVGLAVLAFALADRLAGRFEWRPAARPALAVALVLLAVSPVVPLHYLPRHAAGSAARPRGLTPEESLVRFGRLVRDVTPDTSGYLDPSERPEYGLLADPSLGHALHYLARRPTLSDNFGPYVGDDHFMLSLRLLLTEPTDATVPTLRERGLRYVVTNWQPQYRVPSLLHQLHEHDGRVHQSSPALSQLRLVAEGPPGGLPLEAVLGTRVPPRAVPYKLFEVVEGAVLALEVEPGTRVSARVDVTTPGGRRFVYRVGGIADPDGRAELRVPYATEPPERADVARTRGAYVVRANGIEREVEVREADVRDGVRIPVRLSPGT